MVDITHSIKPFDIKDAAFTFRSAYPYFPKGTIHVIHINSTDGDNKLLVSVVNGHYIITFDSGFLSLAFDKTPPETYLVNDELLTGGAHLLEDAVGKTVNLLIKEFKPSDFGHLATETLGYRLLQPITSPGSIRGTVISLDNFGNAVVNITKTMFEQFIGSKRFTILANVGSVREIHDKYNDVEEGEMVCLFNASGNMEVAINGAKAEHLLGLKIGFACADSCRIKPNQL